MATTAVRSAARPRTSLYEWLTTTDHKKIGILYTISSFIFLGVGGSLALFVRAELAQPGLQFLTESTYNQMFTMHASVMIFWVIIPFLAAIGNYVVPLMIGAPDMAFPRINALSFWIHARRGTVLGQDPWRGQPRAVPWPRACRPPTSGPEGDPPSSSTRPQPFADLTVGGWSGFGSSKLVCPGHGSSGCGRPALASGCRP